MEFYLSGYVRSVLALPVHLTKPTTVTLAHGSTVYHKTRKVMTHVAIIPCVQTPRNEFHPIPESVAWSPQVVEMWFKLSLAFPEFQSGWRL
jgi:hypothetical protein